MDEEQLKEEFLKMFPKVLLMLELQNKVLEAQLVLYEGENKTKGYKSRKGDKNDS